MLNAAVAEVAEAVTPTSSKSAEDFDSGAARPASSQTIKAHKRIIFNGNGYDDAWIDEATEERGLLNLRTTRRCACRRSSSRKTSPC